jgi:hypothetical protein
VRSWRWGQVFCVEWNEWGADAGRRVADDAKDAVAITGMSDNVVTWVDIARGFGGVAIDGDVTGLDGSDGEGAASIDANGPEPQVEAHGSGGKGSFGGRIERESGGCLGFLATRAEAEEFEAM